MQPDTIIPDPSNPQAWNRYAYVLNNSVRYNDPTGHCADPVSGTTCLIGAGAITLTVGEIVAVTVIAVAAVWITAYAIDPNVRSATHQLGQNFSANLEAAGNSSTAILQDIKKTARDLMATMKGEYEPPALNGVDPLTRKRYTDAVEGYKEEHGIPPAVNVPKSILDRLAEAIKKGKRPLEAIDEAPSPPDNLVRKGKTQKQNKRDRYEEE